MKELLIKTKRRINNSHLIRSFIVTILGSGISKFILVAATFICSNTLTKMEFGELSFIRNTLNTFLCICALNFTSLCTKFTTESRQSHIALQRLILVFLFSFAICLMVGLTLVVSTDNFLLKIFGSSIVVKYFRIIGWLLPLFMLQPLIEGVLRGLMKFKLIGILQSLSSLLFLGVVYVGILINGLDGAMFGVMIYYFVYSTASLVIILKLPLATEVFRDLKGWMQQTRVIPCMILPIFIMSFIEAPIMWIAQILLSKYGSMESIAGMTAILQIRNLATLVPSYFANTFISFAGKLNSERNYKLYFKQFDKLNKTLFLSGLGVAIIFSLLSKPILSLYGTAYVSDWEAMAISNFAIPFLMVLSLLKINLVLQEHQKWMLYISIFWNIIWIVTLFLFLKLGMKPLYAFFGSQLIGVGIYLIGFGMGYEKDKANLLND